MQKLSFLPILSKATLADVIPANQKAIISIKHTVKVSEAIKILAENHISSAPVEGPNPNEYIGFLDYVDIVNFVISLLKKEDVHHGQGFLQLMAQDKHFHEQNAAAIVGKNFKGPIFFFFNFVKKKKKTLQREIHFGIFPKKQLYKSHLKLFLNADLIVCPSLTKTNNSHTLFPYQT